MVIYVYMYAFTDGSVRMRYSVLDAEYELKLEANKPTLAMLADFGTADLSPATLHQPVGVAHFTTLENTPPDFLLCAAGARQVRPVCLTYIYVFIFCMRLY